MITSIPCVRACLFGVVSLFAGAVLASATEPLVLKLWPGPPPDDAPVTGPERDTSGPTSQLIAGRPLIRLGHVSVPQLAVYRPAKEKDQHALVVVSPGGGFNILAYDLEGTEVAEWLNGIGITAVVLKYRVPFRDPQNRSRAAVQDTQRALSLVRSRAAEWGIAPDKIGVLGFSAGGAAAAQAALHGEKRQYAAVDAADQQPSRPDFTLLIYTGGGLLESGNTKFRDDVVVPANFPPTFFVHAFDDNVAVQTPLLFAAAIKKAGGSAEVHVYDTGGHGYGLRRVAGSPVTTWPDRAEEWFRRRGIIGAAK